MVAVVVEPMAKRPRPYGGEQYNSPIMQDAAQYSMRQQWQQAAPSPTPRDWPEYPVYAAPAPTPKKVWELELDSQQWKEPQRWSQWLGQGGDQVPRTQLHPVLNPKYSDSDAECGTGRESGKGKGKGKGKDII